MILLEHYALEAEAIGRSGKDVREDGRVLTGCPNEWSIRGFGGTVFPHDATLSRG